MFRLGYNTNGLAHHRVLDALTLLSEIGYGAVSITPDVGQLDPYRLDAREVAAVRRRAEELGLELTIETGSRFLLDPLRKHRPNLLEESEAERARRVDFLLRHVDLAADLGASVVALWAGAAPDGSVGDGRAGRPVPEELWERLCSGMRAVLAHGRSRRVRIAFEPEPGMFLERPAGYEELLERLGAEGDELGLCLDVGHCHATGDLPVADVIRRLAARLILVQLDDCRNGEHVHRMFGEGDLDLGAALRALRDIDFRGVAAVELSRDSHRGAEAAREAWARLKSALEP